MLGLHSLLMGNAAACHKRWQGKSCCSGVAVQLPILPVSCHALSLCLLCAVMNGEQSRLLGEIHIALLKLLVADMEEAYATGAIQVAFGFLASPVLAQVLCNALPAVQAVVYKQSKLLHLSFAWQMSAYCVFAMKVAGILYVSLSGYCCCRVVVQPTSWTGPSSTVPIIWRKLLLGASISMSGELTSMRKLGQRQVSLHWSSMLHTEQCLSAYSLLGKSYYIQVFQPSIC